ncbi:NAD(P)-binding protein [Artomyces pyxidatus]|uniref:NAD(P)-binding protein n=1 Tax=Artomyces pyxidatus TaxID=48021 RepID=A0ACB8TFN6_9AGAM|nr:NAD(P)-binding protein [Artomyces pyxidatus]
MKIVVTGCNGCVGRRVVIHALQAGHTVIGLDTSPLTPAEDEVIAQNAARLTFAQLDLRDFNVTLETFRRCEPDGVVHLASHPNPTDYLVKSHNDNVVLSWNVLRACAELGITRVAQASSVNVVPMAYSLEAQFDYFPLDEKHPCLPDEPYGLSKLIAELQADTIVRRFPGLRIASLRFHWCLPARDRAAELTEGAGKNNLWAWVQEDAVARAILLAISGDGPWDGHERFYIVAPDIAPLDSDSGALREKYYPGVAVRDGYEVNGRRGFFDCGKAERLLGWVHNEA